MASKINCIPLGTKGHSQSRHNEQWVLVLAWDKYFRLFAVFPCLLLWTFLLTFSILQPVLIMLCPAIMVWDTNVSIMEWHSAKRIRWNEDKLLRNRSSTSVVWSNFWYKEYDGDQKTVNSATDGIGEGSGEGGVDDTYFKKSIIDWFVMHEYSLQSFSVSPSLGVGPESWIPMLHHNLEDEWPLD